MRNDKLIPGTILVIIGTLFLLDNLGYIDFSWGAFFHLWPIILIIAGVNLVFAHSRSGIATVVKIAVLVAGMGFLIYSGLGHRGDRYRWNHGFSRRFDFNEDDSDMSMGRDSIVKIEGNGHYKESFKPGTQVARLNVSGGGTSYVLKDATNELFEADTKEYHNHYILKASSDSTTETLDFNMNGNNGRHHGITFNWGGSKTNKAYLKLNPNPEWEISVQTGATKLNFDLTSFKIRKLKLEGGAASFDIKMGQPLTETNVDIETGVSKVIINVPQNVACHITTQTGLSSKSFNGFQNMGDNHYETPDFDKAINKMYIKLSGGVSDFKVKRY